MDVNQDAQLIISILKQEEKTGLHLLSCSTIHQSPFQMYTSRKLSWSESKIRYIFKYYVGSQAWSPPSDSVSTNFCTTVLDSYRNHATLKRDACDTDSRPYDIDSRLRDNYRDHATATRPRDSYRDHPNFH